MNLKCLYVFLGEWIRRRNLCINKTQKEEERQKTEVRIKVKIS